MRVKETRFHRLTLTAGAFIGLALGATNMFATALPVVLDGGILQLGNLSGSLVGVTTNSFCINWGGGSTCAGATHSMNVSGSSSLFSFPSTGTIKDISAFPPPTLVDFKDVTGSTL